jgi:hypothetical protein
MSLGIDRDTSRKESFKGSVDRELAAREGSAEILVVSHAARREDLLSDPSQYQSVSPRSGDKRKFRCLCTPSSQTIACCNRDIIDDSAREKSHGCFTCSRLFEPWHLGKITNNPLTMKLQLCRTESPFFEIKRNR